MAPDAFLELHDQIARDLSSGRVVFPTYFNVTIKVRNLLRDPDLSAAQLAAAVKLEPLLSTRLLQHANAAALRGNSGEITDLKFAIMRVGLDAVRAISFALAMEQLARSKHMAPFASLSQHLWEHSVTTAAFAQCLATRSGRVRPDEAMFAGLVHDIGAFYLLFRCAEHPVLSKDKESLLSLVIDWHDSIGHALLAAMQQPDTILDAVQDHESSDVIAEPGTLRQIVIVADRFAHGIASWLPTEEKAQRQLLLHQGLDAGLRNEIMDNCQNCLTELRTSMSFH